MRIILPKRSAVPLFGHVLVCYILGYPYPYSLLWHAASNSLHSSPNIGYPIDVISHLTEWSGLSPPKRSAVPLFGRHVPVSYILGYPYPYSLLWHAASNSLHSSPNIGYPIDVISHLTEWSGLSPPKRSAVPLFGRHVPVSYILGYP